MASTFATYATVSAEFRKREGTGWECVLYHFNGASAVYQCTGGGENMNDALTHALEISREKLKLRPVND